MTTRIFFLLVLSFVSVKAQMPQIETIDFYGLRTVSERQIREPLRIKEGNAPPKTKEERDEIIKRIEALPNVAEARLSAICCTNGGKTMLYIGVREKGSPSLNFRKAPNGAVRLTAEIVKFGKEFDEAHHQAVREGDAAEDVSAGHSLMKNAEARRVQEKLVPVADQNLKLLRQVLRESSNADHRALAAQIVAYAEDKQAIVEDLVFAMKDADGNVRNNAMRALAIIARYAPEKTEKSIEVPFQPFVEMLNSPEWTDRNKSSLAVMMLTESPDAALLAALREKALTSLIEMAGWKNDGHAGAPFIILGRVAGLSEDEIGRALITGKREMLIEKIKINVETRTK